MGNHEFDNKPAGLAPFIANSSVPIVCCNIDYSREPALASAQLNGRLVPSTVLDVDGVKVGVVGYLTPETKVGSNKILITGWFRFYFIEKIQILSHEETKQVSPSSTHNAFNGWTKSKT